jgi:hypothetical protein
MVTIFINTLSMFGCLFSRAFFVNIKKTMTVNKKRKSHGPPGFNYVSMSVYLP